MYFTSSLSKPTTHDIRNKMNKKSWRTQTAENPNPSGLASRWTDRIPRFHFGRVRKNLLVEVPKTVQQWWWRRKISLRLMDSFLCGQRVGGAVATPPHSPPGRTNEALKTAWRVDEWDGGKRRLSMNWPTSSDRHQVTSTTPPWTRSKPPNANRSESSWVCL